MFYAVCGGASGVGEDHVGFHGAPNARHDALTCNMGVDGGFDVNGYVCHLDSGASKPHSITQCQSQRSGFGTHRHCVYEELRDPIKRGPRN